MKIYATLCTDGQMAKLRRKWILIASILLVSLLYLSLTIGTKHYHEVVQIVEHVIPRTSTENNGKREMKKRFPQCIIFGTMKSGTSALKRLLSTHPKIEVMRGEGHFFERKTYKNGMSFYLNKMPLSYEDQITIEKTPSYFESDLARERIYSFNKSIKLIVTFKDPVTRAISNFRFGNRSARHTFQEYVTLESGLLDLISKPLYRSLYVLHMMKWYSYFPKEQIHVVDGERLIKEPLKEIRMIEEFLGLEHAITNDNIYLNTTTGFYCTRKNPEDNWFCSDRSKVERTQPYVDPEFVQRLKKFYRPYNEQLFKLINRTFDWD